MKKKLFVSAMSLVMAVILMTSTSFAWFTVSTTAEAKNLDVTMQAQKNLEIARAAGGPSGAKPGEVAKGDATTGDTTWGNSVNYGNAGTVNFPATTDASAIKTIQYADDGRVKSELLPATKPSTWASGIAKYTADPGAGAGSRDVAVVYGMWLRTNDAGSYTATLNGAEANTKWSITLVDETLTPMGNTVTLVANTEQFVGVCVYLNGEAVYAKDVASGLSTSGISVSFTKAS